MRKNKPPRRPSQSKARQDQLNENQIPLFAANTPIRLRYAVDAIWTNPAAGLCSLAGMDFKFDPTPKYPEKAVNETMNALRNSHLGLNRSVRTENAQIEPITVEDSSYDSCTVTVREHPLSPLIVVTHESGGVNVSLPALSRWPTSGLGWLLVPPDCCADNENNPTPWNGPRCKCADKNEWD